MTPHPGTAQIVLVCASCRRLVERTFDDDFQHAAVDDGLSCTAWPVRPARACRVCNDTGIVMSPDLDGESAYESACPERVHDGQPCLICGGRGWLESDHCNCGTGPSGYYGMHERHCGLEPCPRGCPFVAPGPARPQEEAPF